MTTPTPYDIAVYIGRFQPFHQGHLACVRHGLTIAKRVLVLVGSINRDRDTRNPWSYCERRTMIHSALSEDERQRVVIRGVRDYEEDANWLAAVNAVVDKIVDAPSARIALLGFKRDATSYYLDIFPTWSFVAVPEFQDISATTVRQHYLTRGDIRGVTRPVADRLRAFSHTSIYKLLACIERRRTETQRPRCSDMVLDPV